MTARSLRRISISMAVVASLLILGCGRDTGPTAPEGMSTNHSADAAAQGGDASSGLLGNLGPLVGNVLQGGMKVVRVAVNGVTGGSVQNGRYKVSFAPGAFLGSQNITVTDLGLESGAIELGPHGLTFSNEVTLEINLEGTGWDSPHPTIEWYNPDSGVWVDMHGTYDPSTHRVRATLPHFSTYRPRAGW